MSVEFMCYTKWAHGKSAQLGIKGTAINLTGCKQIQDMHPNLLSSGAV